MYIVIAGCGRIGARLAIQMAGDGHNVVVIDKEQTAFQNLGPTFNGVTVLGQAIDEDVLCDAGIERADGFAATTSDDNVNIMAAQIARELFRVPRVVARVFEPGREPLFRELGLNPVSATNLAASHIYSALMAAGVHYRAGVGAGEVAEVEVVVDAEHAGLGLHDLEMGSDFRLFAVVRDGLGLIPDCSYRTREGDRMLAAVRANALKLVERRLRLKAGE